MTATQNAAGLTLWRHRLATGLGRSFKTGTAHHLAYARMLVSAMLLVGLTGQDLTLLCDLAPTMAKPNGLMKLLAATPLFGALISAPGALIAIQVLAGLSLVLSLIGWYSRASLLTAALSVTLIGGLMRAYGSFYHADHTPMLLLWLLAVSPCADVWSLDARRKTAPPNTHYGPSLAALWIVIVVTYSASGWSKVFGAGMGWFDADAMRARMLVGGLNTMEFGLGGITQWLHMPDLLLSFGAGAVLLLELSSPTLLISRRARRWLPWAFLVFHGLVWYLQNIVFFELMLLQTLFWMPARSHAQAPQTPIKTSSSNPLRWAVLIALGTLALAPLQKNFYPLSPYAMYARTATFPVRHLRFWGQNDDSVRSLTPAPFWRGRKQLKKYGVWAGYRCVISPKPAVCKGLIQTLSKGLLRPGEKLILEVWARQRAGDDVWKGSYPPQKEALRVHQQR